MGNTTRRSPARVSEGIRGVHQGVFERRSIYPLRRVLRLVRSKLKSGQQYGTLGKFALKVTSHTLTTFALKGTSCVKCGIQGRYFALERHPNALGRSGRWLLNLYAINSKGEEVLMTRDHIIPKSLGGKNTLENHDPMCTICNFEKSNRVERES